MFLDWIAEVETVLIFLDFRLGEGEVQEIEKAREEDEYVFKSGVRIEFIDGTILENDIRIESKDISYFLLPRYSLLLHQ